MWSHFVLLVQQSVDMNIKIWQKWGKVSQTGGVTWLSTDYPRRLWDLCGFNEAWGKKRKEKKSYTFKPNHLSGIKLSSTIAQTHAHTHTFYLMDANLCLSLFSGAPSLIFLMAHTGILKLGFNVYNVLSAAIALSPFPEISYRSFPCITAQPWPTSGQKHSN